EIEKAYSDANIVLKINPNCPIALHTRGTINKLKGKYDDTYLDFKKSLDIKPDFGVAKLNCLLVKRNIDGHIESMGTIRFICFNEIHDRMEVALKYLRASKGYSINIINEVIPFEITRSDDYILDYYGLTKHLEPQKIYLVMEYAEGGNLSDSLSKSYKDIS
ncbi:14296_t:CDS:2, partial [Cetraspora pellucida]